MSVSSTIAFSEYFVLYTRYFLTLFLFKSFFFSVKIFLSRPGPASRSRVPVPRPRVPVPVLGDPCFTPSPRGKNARSSGKGLWDLTILQALQ